MDQVNNNAANRKRVEEQNKNEQEESQEPELENNEKKPEELENNSSDNNSIKAVIKAKIKEKIKKKPVIIIVSLCVLIPILFIVLMVISVAIDLGIIKQPSSSSGGHLVYESECNYEETKVTVISYDGNEIYGTISLEDYIMGVACPEIGACDGTSSSIQEHFVKSQYVSSKTYVLSRGGYNSSTKSITANAGTNWQQWCDLNKGCYYTSSRTCPGDSVHSGLENYDGKRIFTEEDLTTFHKYYQDTYGDLFLPKDYNHSVVSLSWDTATEYKDKTQHYWNDQAKAGKTYSEILESTATSGKPDAEDYANKSVYKLSSYCKATYTGGDGNFIDLEDYPVVYDNAKELRTPITNALGEKGVGELNNYISSNVDKAGHGTGAAVAAAGQSLIYGLYQKGYYLPYWFGGGHDGKLIMGVDTRWGENGSKYSYSDYNAAAGRERTIFSLDCSGFVSWAIRNGCSSKFSSDATPGFISNYGKSIPLKDAKPGDIMVFDEGGGANGHIRLVVKNNGDGSIITAESTSGGAKHGAIQFTTHTTLNESHTYKIIDMTNWYSNNCENIQQPKNDTNNKGNDKTSTGKGKILLVAGHSYSPYCNNFPNECRGKAPTSTYDEETETRKLIKLLKTKLISKGYKSSDIDIANELLGENLNDKSTSRSLYGELKNVENGKASTLNNIKFSNYKYAIEIHFNASETHTVKGVATLCDSGNCRGAATINTEIRSKIAKTLNSANNGILNQSTYSIRHLNGLNIPFTYLETEFYDNQSAMDNYEKNIDKVADAIAESIKKYYP